MPEPPSLLHEGKSYNAAAGRSFVSQLPRQRSKWTHKTSFCKFDKYYFLFLSRAPQSVRAWGSIAVFSARQTRHRSSRQCNTPTKRGGGLHRHALAQQSSRSQKLSPRALLKTTHTHTDVHYSTPAAPIRHSSSSARALARVFSFFRPLLSVDGLPLSSVEVRSSTSCPTSPSTKNYSETKPTRGAWMLAKLMHRNNIRPTNTNAPGNKNLVIISNHNFYNSWGGNKNNPTGWVDR